MEKKVVLIIMDGWGKGKPDSTNAIHIANTPFIDSLFISAPNSELLTSGENVGLPEGQMGNSEVGHLNIGAGRVVYQDLVRINLAVRNKELQALPVLKNTFNYVNKNSKKLHLIGLVSDGGVHSHIDHLKALCDAAQANNVHEIFIHAFTDGRDTDPKSGINYIRDLESHLKNHPAKIASVIGRYYAMDRDKRWERIKLAYDLLVNAQGTACQDAEEAISNSYNQDVTDEFIQPHFVTGKDRKPLAKIEDGDAVICFNFRTDRCREITMALTQQDFHEQNMHKLNLHYVTITNYDATFRNVQVAYEKDNLKNTLGELLSVNNKTQLRIAETEKYPHVTFFFSGGRETVFPNEQRIMIPSPKVPTYDLQPEMSAQEVTAAVCKAMEEQQPDFICLNFANPDMVGHTGVFAAVVKAVETIDSCVAAVVEKGKAYGYTFLITADHGNADYMVNADGSPNTAHTTNPVPLFLLDKDYKRLKNGRLADLAPSILHLMGIPVPQEMTGEVLPIG